ncbi:TetR/AcrR family transcriptional regulator [Nocardioides sp. InS609-2]|uniref:TetR/AcrR family transcriptional regulator n=1 Tax=Nocardioides sp. InS609-2 TaxID=2760705 RepID=UPI0020BE3E3C|nr:TetR/AcrR family transcriptional regulator [Nocardioides sp. InS609-2]
MPVQKVTHDDWLYAALTTLARSGVTAVSVEPIARGLGVTRGSFYWHFKDREALLIGALELWESEATTSFIEALTPITDPAERLSTLLREALTGDEIAGLEPALVAHASDPVVSVVLERVTRRRMAYLEECFRDLGLDKREARLQAVAAYAAYLGWVELRRAAPDAVPEVARTGRKSRAAIDHLLSMLAGSR